MPAYVLFKDKGVPVLGSVRSGIHAGWSELAAFDLAPSDGESPPMVWMLARAPTPLVPRLASAARSGGGRGQASFEPRFSGGVRVGSGLVDGSVRILSDSVDTGSTGITAEVDFTRTYGGGERIVLRAVVHGVRFVAAVQAARTGGDLVMEKITIAHEGITRAGAPRSSADITSQVRGQLGGAYDWAYLLRRPGLLETYDYPGYYAQRFDGIDKGGGS